MTLSSFSPQEQTLREEIILVGKLMYEKGLIVATDGNISARLTDQTLLITPSGLCNHDARPTDRH
jgi:L-fuculose-phosphate aldolase